MSDLTIMFKDAVTDTSSTAKYRVGTRRQQNGREYIYIQADDAITVNQAVKMDSTTGVKVTPTAAATDDLFGVAETAITDEEYGWITVKGVASCKILTAATAGQVLAPTSTAGVLGNPANTDVAMIRAVALQNGAATNLTKNVYLN